MLPLLCTLAIAQTLAMTSTPAGAVDDPRAVVREATRAVENDGVAELRAEGALDLHSHLLSHRAGLRGLLGAPEAMADAEASIAIARRAGDLRAEAQALRSAAKVQFYRSEYPSAFAFFRQAE
jgi:hypothetical protein